MTNTVMNKIFKAAEEIDLANDFMTEALKALEGGATDDCIKYASEVLTVSIASIEQRLAAIYLMDLATKNKEEVAKILDLAYDPNPQQTHNNQAYQTLYKACDEFNASMVAIQAKL